MKIRHLICCVVFLAVPAGYCQQEEPGDVQAKTFEDRTQELGLELGNGGSAWGDVDGDGWDDLYAAGTLWFNDSGKGFTQGPSHGAGILGDLDNDGYLDLFVFSGQVFRNEGGRSFEAVAMPELSAASVLGACWADLDGDGSLDLYVAGFEDWDKGIDYPDRILRGDGKGSFVLHWEETRYRARGATACDFDCDGDVDVYVSNYRLHPNLLWLNDGKANLTEVAAARGVVATDEGFGGGHSIGAAWGDLDNDGWIDLFAGNFAHDDDRGDQPESQFLRNRGPEGEFAFENLGQRGLHYQESYASPALADYDNDGDLDLYFTTVYGTASFGRKNHPVLYRNDGDWTFTNVTEEAGLGELPPTYQAAWADFDQDGDLDLATAGRLYVNRGNPQHHWLEVRLQSLDPAVNRGAVGAQVSLHQGNRTVTRQVEAGTGQGNQNSAVLHFGLGESTEIDRLELSWPGGKRQLQGSVAADRLVTIQRAPD